MSCCIDAGEGEGDSSRWGLGALGDGHHPPPGLSELQGVGEQRSDVAVWSKSKQHLHSHSNMRRRTMVRTLQKDDPL
jgi:hypothetical protein